MAGLPLLILLITKFKGGDAEAAVNALLLPDADRDRASRNLSAGLLPEVAAYGLPKLNGAHAARRN